MTAPTYPSSSDVTSGQATLAAHYNTLRADAIRAGATAANAIGFGTLLQQYTKNVILEYLAVNKVRIPYATDAVPVLVIDGHMLALSTNCDLAAAPSGPAATYYVFANRADSVTQWTISVNTSSIPAADQRLIGEFYWDGANIRLGSIKSYETVATSAINSGVYAQRSASPSAGDIYISTDTLQILVCFVAGGWQSLDWGFFDALADGFMITGGTTPREFTVSGGDLYFDVNSGGAYVPIGKSAKMSAGLCLDQGANDDEILALKSSDVAHGMTTLAETDTYGVLQKVAAADGGLSMIGYTEVTTGLSLAGRYVTDNTTKTTAGIGAINIIGQKKSGTTITDPGANANLLAVRSNATTRFILDADGDSHQDVGTAWTNFDDYDDAQLLQALSLAVSKPEDPIREKFSEFLKYNREALEKARLVTFNEDGHHFVNMSKLTMLLTGAIRQQAAALSEQLDRITRVEGMLERYEDLLAGVIGAKLLGEPEPVDSNGSSPDK
jgi:hypothetical protein